MDVRSRNEEKKVSPQLLDLIPKHHKQWHMNHTNKACEERKLELRLAPPGADDWSLNHNNTKNVNTTDDSLLSLSYFPQSQKISSSPSPSPSPWSSSTPSSFLHFPSSSSSTSVIDLQNAENKAFSPSPANTAVPNTSQKRTAPGPVVGWPPIRSFRKNLASSSSSNNNNSKTAHETQQHQNQNQNQHVVVADKVVGKKAVVHNVGKGLFVKINMDGIPIGRKVDLNAYDSYEKLSSAVDELFRCLLAAQRDSSAAGGIQNKEEEEEEKAITISGLLDGSGEYTLVYEDNEGDRMLVGDVPWHMFISTVKRLRVLKSSELSAFTRGGKQEKKITT